MRKTSGQLVQNLGFGRGVNFHNLHSIVDASIQLTTKFHTFRHNFTHNLALTVHKISAKITDMVSQFSAEYTGPITTTTTFIYKKIEKEAV